MSIIIRPVTEKDKTFWLPLWHAYNEFYKTTIGTEQTNLTWQRLLNPDFNMFGLVALQGEEVIGMTHYLYRPSTWSAGDYCYLEDLFVFPEVRGQGVGRALIDEVKQAAINAGAARLYWTTAPDNVTARKLYDTYALANMVQYQIKIDPLS